MRIISGLPAPRLLCDQPHLMLCANQFTDDLGNLLIGCTRLLTEGNARPIRRPGQGTANWASPSWLRTDSTGAALCGINVTPNLPFTHCTAVANDVARVLANLTYTPDFRQMSRSWSRKQWPSSNNSSGNCASTVVGTRRLPESGCLGGSARTKSS